MQALILPSYTKRRQDVESKIDGRLFLGVKATTRRTEHNRTELKDQEKEEERKRKLRGGSMRAAIDL